MHKTYRKTNIRLW